MNIHNTALQSGSETPFHEPPITPVEQGSAAAQFHEEITFKLNEPQLLNMIAGELAVLDNAQRQLGNHYVLAA